MLVKSPNPWRRFWPSPFRCSPMCSNFLLENSFSLGYITTMLRVRTLVMVVLRSTEEPMLWATSLVMWHWKTPALSCPALAFCSELPGWFGPVVLAAGGFPPRLMDQNEGWLCPQPGVSNSWSQSSPVVSITLLVSLTFVYAASAGSKLKRGEPARSLRSDIRGS